MKRNLSLLVLAACSLFTAVTLLHTHFAKHSLTADGVPPPPWPPHSLDRLVADGVPPPPWPHLGEALLADGVPPPPWPPKADGILADSAIV